MTKFCQHNAVKLTLVDGFCGQPHYVNNGVVEGGMGERCSPKYFVRECRSPNDIKTRGSHGDTVAFPQAGLQRNAKSMVS